jgi:hypothetical protein
MTVLEGRGEVGQKYSCKWCLFVYYDDVLLIAIRYLMHDS